VGIVYKELNAETCRRFLCVISRSACVGNYIDCRNVRGMGNKVS